MREKPQPEEPQGLTVNGEPFPALSKEAMPTFMAARMTVLWQASKALSENLHWFSRRRFCTAACGQETLIDDLGRCLVCGHPYSSPTLWGTSWPPAEQDLLIPGMGKKDRVKR